MSATTIPNSIRIVDENGRPTMEFLRILNAIVALNEGQQVFQAPGGMSGTIDLATAATIEVNNGLVTGQT